jgi:pimeloyl-ACP methyl ester carboxylesterase
MTESEHDSHTATPRRDPSLPQAPVRGRTRTAIRRIVAGAAILLLCIVGVAALLAAWPASTAGLGSSPHPLGSYREATAAFAAVRSGETASVIPTCRSRLLTHGRRTDHVIVLVHGLTNCPEQWVRFGREIYARGWNVLILRLPDHGLGDVATDSPGGVGHLDALTASKLARYGDDATDVAQGLGRHVTVMGLSLGGTVAAWVAQERHDVDRAVVVAPGLGMEGAPYLVSWLATNLFAHLPDISINGRSKVRYEYQGWSTHGISDTFVLGKRVTQDAESRPPGTHSIDVLLNPNDNTISNSRAEHLASAWKRHGADVHVVWLPDRPKLEHDIVDPHQPWARPSFVYPRLEALVEAP